MNILLIRLSAIGDVVMSSGLIPAIKARYPDATLTWLVEPAAAGLLRENEQLDHVIVWPKAEWKALWKARRWLKLWGTIRQFRSQLHAQKFDVVLDAQGILKSSVLAWLSGAPRRIGLGTKEGSGFFYTEVAERRGHEPEMCSEYLGLAEYFGCERSDFRMSVEFNGETRGAVEELLTSRALASPYVVVCPFTTRPQKHWRDDYWLELMRSLAAEGKAVVMLGGPGDVDHAKALVENAKVSVLNLVGATNLLQATAIIDGAESLVGVDTGLTHLGIARHTPTVAIFGSTRPYLHPIATDAEAQDKTRVIYHEMSCSPCRRRPTCNGEFTCMKNIKSEEVLKHLEELVA